MLGGLRNGFTLSITGAVVGEMVIGGGDSFGLSTLLITQRDAANTAGMFATIVVLCLVAATLYSLIYIWGFRRRENSFMPRNRYTYTGVAFRKESIGYRAYESAKYCCSNT